MFIAWVTEDWVMYQCNNFSGTLYFMDIGNSNTFLKTPTAVHLCKKRTFKKKQNIVLLFQENHCSVITKQNVTYKDHWYFDSVFGSQRETTAGKETC